MLEQLKSEVCALNKKLSSLGLVILTWGNASAIDRESGLVAIKPSGVPFDKLTPQDIVILDQKGKIIEGKRRPSTDTPTHMVLYKEFSGVHAIIHTHSLYATSFAQAKRGITCMGTTHADHFYGTVPVTRELTEKETAQDYEKNTGKVIVETFRKKKLDPLMVPACLVASHGVFVWGNTVEHALENAQVLEKVAEMNIHTRLIASGSKPISQDLLDKHFLRKHGKSAYYGQKGWKHG